MLIQLTLATGLALFGNQLSQHLTVWLKQLRRRRRTASEAWALSG